MRYIFSTGRHPVEMTGQEVPATDRNPSLPRLRGSGSLPATMDGANGDMPHAASSARPLIESHPNRIVVGDCTIFLSDGMACSYPLGTPLEVEYVEQNGRGRAEKITPTPVGSSAQMRTRLSRGGVGTSR